MIPPPTRCNPALSDIQIKDKLDAGRALKVLIVQQTKALFIRTFAQSRILSGIWSGRSQAADGVDRGRETQIISYLYNPTSALVYQTGRWSPAVILEVL